MNRMSDAEFDIMEVLWKQSEPIQPSVLLNLMKSTHNWNISTLNTLINRLEEKGFVEFIFKGRLKYVFYKLSKSEYGQKEAKNVLKRLFDGSTKSMVAALVDQELSDNEIYELEMLINKHKGK